MSTFEAIGHATSIFLLVGFVVFFWITAKGLRKIRKRARKASRREKKNKRLP